MIDFESSDSHLLLNPRLPAADRLRLEGMVPPLGGHVFVATSGSTGEMKLVALSKTAILASAEAVNRRLGASRADVWYGVLPVFHVGGLGILARAHLTGSRVVHAPSWNAELATSSLERNDVTLVSFVPTQLFDLVREGLGPPASLRHALIGGGRLEETLERDARALGWPILTSYGSTECASTVAVAREDGELELLTHFEAAERGGCLALRGAALLTGYCGPGGAIDDPKVGGWFVTEDRGMVEGRVIRVEGRNADFVKIGGESVDLGRLDRIAAEVGGTTLAVLAVPDARLGAVIHLVVEKGSPADGVEDFNRRVQPFERAREVHQVDRLPRSELGKLLRSKLLQTIRRMSESSREEGGRGLE